VRQLNGEYRYDGIETCAVDGMCRNACPVLIDTGDLTRRLRIEQHTAFERRSWAVAARHWGGATRLASAALTAAKTAPAPLAVGVLAAARAVLGDERVSAWSPGLPRGGRRRAPRPASAPAAVYFPAYISAVFSGPEPGGGVDAAFLALCERARFEVRIPDDVARMCCGTPWKSKGLLDGYRVMQDVVIPSLRRASEHGGLPIVVGAASCTEGLQHLLAGCPEFRVLDAVQFIATTVLTALPPGQRFSSLVLHPTCASTQLDGNASLLAVAGAAADKVTVPESWNCCAFAGDRGMLHPELTASATSRQAAAVKQTRATAFASVNRTCELAMTQATGPHYRHVLEILEQVTRAAPGPLPPAAVSGGRDHAT
jgi:D-lactate dehydrogenase